MNQKFPIFQKKIWTYYRAHRRDFLWRRTQNPYHIFVSEVMLQQTQTERVAKKYPEFIKRFPNFKKLADAPLQDILATWHGMGYNRRALFLKRTAEIIRKDHNGILPKIPNELVLFPGIGAATAASIAVFAFQHPAPFIETNIRRVFIHEFFPRKKKISDHDIMPFVEKTMDRRNPREWFYALMDYGAHLGKTVPNPNRKSRHYVRQAKFEGSHRQLRGKIISLLVNEAPQSTAAIAQSIKTPLPKVAHALVTLTREGITQNKNGKFTLAE